MGLQFSRLILVMLYLGLGHPVLLCAAESSTHYFDQKIEFPNYVLPQEYRNLPTDKIPETVLSEVKTLLAQAVSSELRRMVIPIIPEGKSDIVRVRYYDYLQAELKKIDATIELLPVGGTIRSTLSSMYRELYEVMQKNPNADPRQLLKEIAARTEDIAVGDLLGVGSDLDTLFKTKTSAKDSLIVEKAEEITNSMINRFGSSEDSETMRRVFFVHGDIKPYEAQMLRAVAQGGSELDHLALSLRSGQFIEPTNGRSPTPIVSDFIRGYYRFLPPESPSAVEDAAKVLIRGPRALTEIPFLKIHPEDAEYFKSQVQELQSKIHQGAEFSEKALEQFDKLVRNSRFSGAHNRFYRAPPGSVESSFLALAKTLDEQEQQSAAGAKSLLPEFADHFPIEGAPRPLQGLPRKLLMKPEQFMKKYTDSGALYHGTNVESGIGVLRGGLYISSGDNGRGLHGRGVYTTPDIEFASKFAGDHGLTLNLKINPADVQKLNILDFSNPLLEHELRHWAEEAERQGRDFYELLARDHGIDIIVNEYVLLQNAAIIEYPKSADALLETYANRFRSQKLPLVQRMNAGIVYETFSNYKRAQGAELPHLDWAPVIERALNSSASEAQMAALAALRSLHEASVPIDRKNIILAATKLKKTVASPVREQALSTLFALAPERSDVHSTLFEFMKSEDIQVGGRASEILGTHFDKLQRAQPDFIRRFAAALPSATTEFTNSFAIDLRGAQDSPAFFSIVKELLRSSDLYTRQRGFELLAEPGRKLPSDIAKRIGEALIDEEADIRSLAADVLVNINFQRERKWLFPLLEAQLKKEPEQSIRSALVKALGPVNSLPEAKRAIALALKDKHSNVRAWAMEAAAKTCAGKFQKLKLVD